MYFKYIEIYLTVKDASIALGLLGAEQVLVAALALRDGVGGALGLATLPVVHVNLILDVALSI